MKSNITKILSLALVFVLVLGVFTGCAAKKPEASAANTLVFANDYMSQKFSPFFADTSYDQDAVAMTQVSLLTSDREGNVVLNGKDGVVIPYNGTDYTYNSIANCEIIENADGTVTYKIDMRDDVKFSDGKKLTADDVIFTMYVLSDPTFDGSSTLYSQAIVGMEAYRSGMDTLFNLIAAAGRDNTDFTNWDEATQTAFWADIDQAGAQFAQEIADYCIAAGYGTNVAEGAAAWGFDGLAADATAADFFNMMYDAYAGDIATMNSVESAGTSFFDFMENYAAYTVGVAVGSGVGVSVGSGVGVGDGVGVNVACGSAVGSGVIAFVGTGVFVAAGSTALVGAGVPVSKSSFSPMDDSCSTVLLYPSSSARFIISSSDNSAGPAKINTIAVISIPNPRPLK